MNIAAEREVEFEKDVKAYLGLLPELLKQSEGQYVLIGAAALGGVFDSREEAMHKGYETFGDRGFIVRPISKKDLESGREWLEACPS